MEITQTRKLISSVWGSVHWQLVIISSPHNFYQMWAIVTFRAFLPSGTESRFVETGQTVEGLNRISCIGGP